MQTRTPRRLRQVLFGDRAFYGMVLMLVLPMIAQNAVSNFVNLLDNLMVGRIGTDPMTGVSIVNQLMFVYNLCIFGGLSGAGIFAAQYHGAGDPKGVRYCFRFKLWLCAIITSLGLLVFLTAGRGLVGLYLNEDDPARVASTLGYAMSYLGVMLWGLLPFALSQSYASTLREVGETRVPMFASITAVLINLVLNYVLIYGHLGLPALGVVGAALATVISRYAELAIVAIYAHRHTDRYLFILGAYSSPRIPMKLVRDITVKGMPLLLNEALWATGMSVIAQCYSTRGLDVVSALNISNTVANLMNTVFISMGGATGIIIGQLLGAGKVEEARRNVWWLLTFSLLLSLGTSAILAVLARTVPQLYNTEETVRALATSLLRVCCCAMPLQSFANSTYFTLRSGGKTMVTFLFDSGFTWLLNIPLAFALTRLTPLPVVTCYFLVCMSEAIKCLLGYIMIRKGLWINRIV